MQTYLAMCIHIILFPQEAPLAMFDMLLFICISFLELLFVQQTLCKFIGVITLKSGMFMQWICISPVTSVPLYNQSFICHKETLANADYSPLPVEIVLLLWAYCLFVTIDELSLLHLPLLDDSDVNSDLFPVFYRFPLSSLFLLSPTLVSLSYSPSLLFPCLPSSIFLSLFL